MPRDASQGPSAALVGPEWNPQSKSAELKAVLEPNIPLRPSPMRPQDWPCVLPGALPCNPSYALLLLFSSQPDNLFCQLLGQWERRGGLRHLLRRQAPDGSMHALASMRWHLHLQACFNQGEAACVDRACACIDKCLITCPGAAAHCTALCPACFTLCSYVHLRLALEAHHAWP